MTSALFVVGGGTQWDDALRIAAELPGRHRVLELGTLELVEPPPPGTPYAGQHWPEQGVRSVQRVMRTVARVASTTDVVVLGQDAGRLQRVAARAARRRHLPVAVVPDGALFDARAELPPRMRAQETVLRWAGATCGEPLRFGATAPDLWCAWGEGWIPLLRQFSPTGRIVVTGSPRASDLAALPAVHPAHDRILVCSQPTWVHPFPPSDTAGPTWYRWVDRIVRSAPAGSVRVRLHPRERDIADQLGLTDAVTAVATHGTTLGDDFAGADAVVAPFSTVLIEAAAAGRRVLSVIPEAACTAVRDRSPALVDRDLAVRQVEEVPDHATLVAALASSGDVTAWGTRYARVAPDTAACCARALTDLVAA